jgi:arylsulfatase A-like enzyme
MRSRPATYVVLPSPLAALALTSLACASAPAAREEPRPARPPNVVLIFNDDMGYADVGPFGAQGIPTPHLDRMAKEGARLTSFYVAQAVCSASRAALLTGSYSNRVSILGALGPRSKMGLHPDEVTIPEVLKTRGYATAIYGKWHLGDSPAHLPTRQGFDEWYGLPYSNDMHPQNRPNDPPLPLYENENVVATEPDQTQLVTSYTERAVRFIERNRARPFFLYLAHNMPHVPLHVSDKHHGKSGRGLYGDVIAEIDWSVGEILGALGKHGLDRDTLVIFTSDNGPWLLYGDHAGSAGPLRAGKTTVYEGGVRVPAIFRWPGRIPAGLVSDEVAGTIDLLPTLCRLAGAAPPNDRVLDGRDVLPLLTTPGARSPHEAFLLYWGRELHAVRSGRWKLHFPHAYGHVTPGQGGARGRAEARKTERALYDLAADVGETTDVAAQHPEIVARLEGLAARAREDLGDALTGQVGRRIRPGGRAE